jgi:DNA ligase-associated metallophosphoesterase
MDFRDVKISWAGQNFELIADRALFWIERATLIFSDVHLGKAHDFQAAGIPIPSSVHDEDLGRIAALVETYAPKRVLILGDFVHSHATELNDLITVFKRIKAASGAEWILALGNHDWRAKDKLLNWGFDAIVIEVEEDGIVLSHDPEKSAAHSIGGHVHPVVKLGSGRDRMRLPCFVVNEKRIVLPSFGSFTGGFEIKPRPKDRIYVASHETIVSL